MQKNKLYLLEGIMEELEERLRLGVWLLGGANNYFALTIQTVQAPQMVSRSLAKEKCGSIVGAIEECRKQCRVKNVKH